MGAISYTSYRSLGGELSRAAESAQHRMTRGLAFGAAYTFSKALGTQGLDPYTNQRQWYYGPLNQDRTHMLSWNFAYNIPTFGLKSKVDTRGPRRLDDVRHRHRDHGRAGDAICSSTAAFPYSDPSLTGIGTNSISGVRCEVMADPQKYAHDFYNNFNTAAFALAPIGTFGNTGVGVLRQPGYWNLDAALDKRSRFGSGPRSGCDSRHSTSSITPSSIASERRINGMRPGSI